MFLQIKYQPNITKGGGMIWGVRIAIFTVKSDIWYKNWSPFCLFLDLKICAIWQLDYIKVSQYQLECNERGLVCNEACLNLSQLLRVWYFMWALKHAKQVSWIEIMAFWNRKEGLWLYHILKLLILFFGFIMMFDTTMFLLSFDTDYIGWKHQA